MKTTLFILLLIESKAYGQWYKKFAIDKNDATDLPRMDTNVKM